MSVLISASSRTEAPVTATFAIGADRFHVNPCAPYVISTLPPTASDLARWSDTVLYEAHVKGISRQHPEVPEVLRGTYPATTLVNLRDGELMLVTASPHFGESGALESIILNVRNITQLNHLKREIEKRRGDASMAELEAARAARYGLALSIALFAPEEPSVLRALPEHEQERLDWELGNRLASTIRQGPDVLARFALGEWALLLPHTGLDGAIAVAQRGLDRVNDPELRAGIQSPSRLAIAAGVASHQPVRRYGVETVGQLLQAAERAQRQSRALGGGRAVGWTCDVAPGPEPHA